MPCHVFIIHSSSDDRYVARLAEEFVAHDIPTWFDHALDYGETWELVIRERLDTCSAVVPVMTPAAERSTWVAREIHRAEVKRRPIRPLLLQGDVFFALGHLRYEDVRQGQMPSQRYLASLRSLTGQPAARGAMSATVDPVLLPEGRRSLPVAGMVE